MVNAGSLIFGALSVASLASASASAAFHAIHGHQRRALDQPIRHRRHHARSTQVVSRRSKPSSGTCKSKGKKSKGSGSKSGSSGSSNSTTSASSGSFGYPKNVLAVNGVHFGMVPDGGSDGGPQNTMASLNQLVSTTGNVHATFGQYAQAQGGTLFDGSQLLQVMDDLKSSGAVFEPAVMPTPGSAGDSWWGLRSGDNAQAVAICTVMKKFTDEGIVTRLRFAHEQNWYQSDGTYSGNAQDFIEGWGEVASACKSIAPDVQMFWTPNVANLDTYMSYAPDMSTVNLIGIDFYPNSGTDLSTAFVQAMQPFHDKYASASIAFAIGETGLGYAGPVSDKAAWITSISQAKSSMQHLTSCSWFNYMKEWDYKIADPSNSDTTAAYLSFLQSS